MRPLVFINYRGLDDPSAANLLYRAFTDWLGRDAVFLDHESIPLGADFAAVILDRVRNCTVLLVLIGPKWLATDDSGRRLIDDPEDWVRQEILAALAHGVRIVPLLVGDDTIAPAAADLPPEMAVVANVQWFQVRHHRMSRDIDHLAGVLAAQFPALFPPLPTRTTGVTPTPTATRPGSRADSDTTRRTAGQWPHRAALSVATLKPDPMAVEADHAIDWVDRFDGSSEYYKRRPLAPATWRQLQSDLEAIPHHLPRGCSAVQVTGSFRQATAFTIGAALRMVTGTDIAMHHRSRLWASDAPFDHPIWPIATEDTLGQGEDLAIAVAVAANPTEDVLRFARNQALPLHCLLTLTPQNGVRDNAVPDTTTAVALAVGIRDLIRGRCRTHPRVHLFLAGPTGLALLLGHRWNNLRPTVVYEDVRSELRYEQAFTVDA